MGHRRASEGSRGVLDSSSLWGGGKKGRENRQEEWRHLCCCILIFVDLLRGSELSTKSFADDLSANLIISVPYYVSFFCHGYCRWCCCCSSPLHSPPFHSLTPRRLGGRGVWPTSRDQTSRLPGRYLTVSFSPLYFLSLFFVLFFSRRFANFEVSGSVFWRFDSSWKTLVIEGDVVLFIVYLFLFGLHFLQFFGFVLRVV